MGFKPGSGELSDLDVDSGTLSVDETNNRVGLGTTSPKTALTVEGTITLKEQADADSDTPAYGQIWVNTATPCELYFTTDAGDDIQLTSGAATSLAADDITAGDAAVSISTTSGNITVDSNAGAVSIDGHTGVTVASSNSGDITLNSAANLAVTADTATFASANANDPLVVIKNTTDDANGPRLRFVKDKGAAGAANDVAGLIEFYADDASQDQVLFSEIKSQVKVHTNGQEGGKFTVSVAENDGTSTAGLVIEDGDADGELDVTIGAGAASLTTIAGDLDIPNGGFALGSDASGDMYYRDSSGVFTRIAVGSDNHILTLDGAVPGWEAAGAASSLAADDITAGDAAVSISTTSGNITVDSNAGAVSIDGHTGVTIASSNSGNITLDSVADIVLSGSSEVRVENDLRLDSDSSVISMGAQDDATFTHDGTTGLTIAATPISINSTGNLTLDSTTDIVLSGSSEVRVENDLRLDSDSSVISMGAQNDATFTHDGTTGLTIAANPLIIDGTATITLSGSTDVRVENDLRLDSDSSVISMGAQNDATFTHDGTTGLTIAATPISIDSTGVLDLNSTTGDINFQDGGTNQLSLDMDGTAGAIIMQLKVDGDDLVFQKYDGTEVLKLDDVGNTIVGGSLIEQQVAPNDLVNDDETAISVASMLKRIATVTIASSDKEKDTDTAANIVDALENPVANQSFDFIIINLGEGFENSTLTVEAGTGVTLVGSMAVMSEASATFRVRLTNVSGGSEAVTIYRIG